MIHGAFSEPFRLFIHSLTAFDLFSYYQEIQTAFLKNIYNMKCLSIFSKIKLEDE